MGDDEKPSPRAIQSALSADRVAIENASRAMRERRRPRPRRVSDEHLRALFTKLPIPAYWWQKQGSALVLTQLNEAAQELVGAEHSALLGKPASELYPDMPEMPTELERCLKRQISIKLERRCHLHGTAKLKDLVLTFVFVPPDSVVVHAEDIGERKRAEQALEARVRQQAVIAELGQEALRALDLSTLMNTVVSRVAHTLDAQLCGVLELLPDGSGLRVCAAVGFAQDIVGTIIGAGQRSPAGYTILSGEPVIIADLLSETRFESPTPLLQNGAVSGMTAIIRDRHGPLGVLAVHTTTKRRFTADDINFVQAAANVLAAAIERRRAEAALRESEERFRSLVEGSLAGIIIHVDRKPVFANQAYAEMLGYRSPEDILRAQSVDDFIAPHERERLRQYNRARLRGEDAPVLYEFEGLRKDGSTVTLQNAVRVVHWEGSPTAIQSTVIDISDRKRAELALRESEARFRTVFQVSPMGMVIADPDGRIIRTNHSFQAMLGYGADELRRLSISELSHAADRRATERLLADIVAGRRNGGRLEKRYRHKDGALIWAASAVSAIRAEGEVKYLVTMVEDISERRKAEELLRRSRLRLRNLAARLHAAREQERAAIAREIHDELGQVLTGLKLDLAWLHERLPTPERPLAERIESMLALMDSTLDTVRRLSTGLRPPILDDLGLEAAIEWQVQEFASRSGCECGLQCDIVELVSSRDRDTAVFRILQEALTNISRHARARRVRVTLQVRGGQLVLQVSDDGVGISKLAISSNESLGLIGMSERARAFGGGVRIEALPNAGTRVTLKVPLRYDEETRLP